MIRNKSNILRLIEVSTEKKNGIRYSFLDVSNTGEGYAWHLWSLSSEGSLNSVPHLLLHGASAYNGHLRGPVTLTHIAERLAVELSLPGLSWLGLEHQPSACGVNAPTHCCLTQCILVYRKYKFVQIKGRAFFQGEPR